MIIRKEIKIALSAICAVVLLFYGLNFLKGINLLDKNNTYHVVFSNISGLSKNNAVYANGFPVGIVRDIVYDYDHLGRVCAKIEVDDRMRIPKGTRAELTSSMLGAVTMNLVLGTASGYITPGDSLPGAPQQGALDQAAELMPQLQQMMPKLDSILTAVNTLMSDPALGQTLHNVENITANLTTTTTHLNQLTGNDLPRLTKKMDAIGDNMTTISNKLAGLDYEATLANVNQTLENTNRTIAALQEKMDSKNGNVGLLLNDRALYDNLNATLSSTNNLLIDLREHPKRYVHFSLFGKKDK